MCQLKSTNECKSLILDLGGTFNSYSCYILFERLHTFNVFFAYIVLAVMFRLLLQIPSWDIYSGSVNTQGLVLMQILHSISNVHRYIVLYYTEPQQYIEIMDT